MNLLTSSCIGKSRKTEVCMEGLSTQTCICDAGTIGIAAVEAIETQMDDALI